MHYFTVGTHEKQWCFLKNKMMKMELDVRNGFAERIKCIVPALEHMEINEFISRSRINAISEGGYFIEQGQVPKKFGFLISGLARYFYRDGEGREFTKMFFSEHSFISSYTAMINKAPSFFTIQALTPIRVLEINFQDWLVIRNKSEKWNLFLIALLEKGYAVKEKRERELLILDAESRYKIFRDDFCTVESQIKQHLIASYLGITPVALSRIRKKMGLVNLG